MPTITEADEQAKRQKRRGPPDPSRGRKKDPPEDLPHLFADPDDPGPVEPYAQGRVPEWDDMKAKLRRLD